jgi:hypothetical protein
MSEIVATGAGIRDAPLRLATAASLAFPDGSMTAAGLRREAKRGRLVIERIAGKDFTTLANIDCMRELCRVPARELDSTNGGPEREMARSSRKQFGSSEMVNIASPQDALRLRLKQSRLDKQKKR